MNWPLVIVGLVVLLAFIKLIGFVKSLLRLGIALIFGVLAALATTWVLQSLELTESVPDAVVLGVGALAALSILIRRR